MNPDALHLDEAALHDAKKAEMDAERQDFDPATTAAFDPDKVQDAPEGCGFSAWLWRQENRPDAIGQLARVAKRDPWWPGGDREATMAHLVKLGANVHTQAVLTMAWDAYEANRAKAKQLSRKRQARKQQKQARRRNRR